MANPDFTGVLSSDRSSFEGELPGSIHFGIQGPPGPPGKDGTVAFEDLTAEQIERLRGPKGPSGKTAYEYALDGGYTGSETDFVTKLTTEYLPLSGGDMTGELKMNGQPISGLNDPTANDQAANMGFVNQRVRKAAPRNLLDNSDFRNPVNQRGITVSNNGFIVDRWYAFDGDVTISENGIFTTGNGYIQQRLLSGTIKPESVYTLAVYYSDGTADVNTNGEYASIADFDIVNYIRSNGKTISAVALYEGEYTIDTLPEYQSKGYANELLVCNQYDPETGEYIGITSTPTDAVLKSNVVNNFTTTEPGFVADARALKVLNDKIFLGPDVMNISTHTPLTNAVVTKLTADKSGYYRVMANTNSTSAECQALIAANEGLDILITCSPTIVSTWIHLFSEFIYLKTGDSVYCRAMGNTNLVIQYAPPKQ